MKITSRVLVILLSLGIATQAADQLIVLKAARLFDGKSNALLQNAVVIVQGDKIVDAGSNLPIPSGAQVIDLGNATLAPGFMDAHTHLTADFSGNYNERRLQQLDLNVSEQAIRATAFARATIEAGFTTVRDLGSRFVASHEFVDVALRNSINKRVIVGHECWLQPRESERPADPSMRRMDFAIFSSDANRTTRMALQTGLMKFERQSALKSRTAQTLSRLQFP